MRRFALAAVAAAALGAPLSAMAHDCSSPDDCSRLPPNVDAGTGIAAVAAGTAAAIAYFRRRRGTPAEPPCQDLRNEVKAGEARISDLEAQIADAQRQMQNAPAPPPSPPEKSPTRTR